MAPLIQQLASAGIVGLVMGLAARPVLGNLIAGLQVEGEWGRIEEITLTYGVIRIWDDRRLVVLLQYFIEHPFENWTRSTARSWSVFLSHFANGN